MLTAEDKALLREHIAALKRYVKAIEAQEVKRKTLIKVCELKQITVWQTKEQLRKAREVGYVKQVKNDKGIFYIKESIDPMFLKMKIA